MVHYENGIGSDIVRPSTNPYTYELVSQIAQWVLQRTNFRPKIGVISGTGLSGLSEMLSNKEEFPYEAIPNFPQSTVSGHAGNVVFGYLDCTQVICFNGRFHYYEGYSSYQCTVMVKLMKLIGVSHLIMSNAAGALNENYLEGDVMIMKDHINLVALAGANPLRGPNDPRWGERFISTTEVYNQEVRQLAKEAAQEAGMESFVREGVYCIAAGPSFETIAECRMMKMFGADVVGMSTINEALTAVHCGMTVFAFSLITNIACLDYEKIIAPSHEEHLNVGAKRTPLIRNWIRRVIQKVAKQMEDAKSK